MCASTGQMICQAGKTVNTCLAKAPQAEGSLGSLTCRDKLDNDCDGKADFADPNCAQTCVPSTEVCDGVDNDCDGQIDEGVKKTYYRDADADGYGSASVTTQACTQPAGYVTKNTDCNDSNASIHPGVDDEICNGIDENCNGKADEGYESKTTTCGLGICSATGQSVCQAGKIVNTCIAGKPQIEGPVGSPTCGDSLDNDCDGRKDKDDSNCATQCIGSKCNDDSEEEDD
ncbi:MAG: putative metal-binding motif-containing protein [Nitrospirae bacterium]|nr:putative metal-binding motif-containing protein [Nitrospirota bacterium]